MNTQNWERWGFAPWDGDVANTLKIPLHMCYHIWKGGLLLAVVRQRLCAYRREPPNGKRWACPLRWGVANPYKHTPHYMCYPAEFGRSRSNGTNVTKDIRLKKIDHHVPLYKVTPGHRN